MFPSRVVELDHVMFFEHHFQAAWVLNVMQTICPEFENSWNM